MKIISWNVNGLRAVHRKELFLPFIKKEKPDILCLQETKAEEVQLPEEIKNIPGYFGYFSHSKGRKGYSGVGIYTKIEPEQIEEGMGIKKFDDEGRLLTLYFKNFVLLNVYFPNGGGESHRLKYKLDFYEEFLKHIEKLKKKNKEIIFCGDVNVAHEAIDIARPKENEGQIGFLPEERAWIDEYIAHGYIDIFRYFNSEKQNAYTWWDMKTRARDRNVGWRIDYFFASRSLLKKITGTKILSDVLGSDHCPIVLDISL
jgi:exodeoxyribonuclease-3